ncbi:UDP-N-acetylmuramoyl-tripeptide--D-alanyl-D-alanine ligase [Peptoclostridium litorale DSM 5388]|uniref:UDP-N-acetylmuramoyl-tripeptide--D-alanyl-D-alanine ligase n=1 Tax=Peptoclostridium litorale DSM 5388 TaxID=1121324 RepID=A0A069RE46_PEPLI|nr:UDP-N-acetylmuramoyl-tripeptide--D-alanyl-D-alanine ligase [Peptoclostridium litorale]KDR95018.1 UDP-N-acetylmuramoyl-tripeptide--D-alanyl-D-alanine ligase MurF [Peptoclostridium litorale DSM 5388]SIN76417.1 UDP-N-acetylmuramoyl-tripeptide--D-alanyl-D-alanine ligase [Peptoclostridium litorale DSM 5388]
MENVRIVDILEWTRGKLYSGNAMDKVAGICIDSRVAKPSQTYVAIKGERFDGHSFIEDVFEKGARSFIKEARVEVNRRIRDLSSIVEVEDTTAALADIARGYKSLFDVKCVGITGSCGKTSTKTMVYNVLSKKYKTHRNKGNFNNHIGLPLTMFELDKSHEAAIFEMGMSNLGEIDLLASIARPQIAIITNIGYSHIENLGSRENILKAKMEVTNFLDDDSILIVNGDDELLKGIDPNGGYRIVKFGFEGHNDIICTGYDQDEYGIRFKVLIHGSETEFYVPSRGRHNIYNALAAICTGIEADIDIKDIVSGVALFENEKMRLDIIEKSFIIINDAYNANPDSMKSALDFMTSYEGRRKICVFGDMLEMGSYAREGHEMVGKHASDKVDIMITVGKDSKYILDEALKNGLNCGRHFESRDDASKYIKAIVKPKDVVLVKGSRGMKMEEIVISLEERSSI